MSNDDAASAIASVASVSTQPVIPPIVPFVLDTTHVMQGVIKFVKSGNFNLHKKGTLR